MTYEENKAAHTTKKSGFDADAVTPSGGSEGEGSRVIRWRLSCSKNRATFKDIKNFSKQGQHDLGNKKQIKLRESFKNGQKMIVFLSNLKKKYLCGPTSTLIQFACSRALIGMDFLCTQGSYLSSHWVTDLWFVESTNIMFLIITSKRIKLESRAKSQIVGNSFAVPDLM